MSYIYIISYLIDIYQWSCWVKYAVGLVYMNTCIYVNMVELLLWLWWQSVPDRREECDSPCLWGESLPTWLALRTFNWVISTTSTLWLRSLGFDAHLLPSLGYYTINVNRGFMVKQQCGKVWWAWITEGCTVYVHLGSFS